MKMIGNVSDWLSYAGGALIKVADSAGSTVFYGKVNLSHISRKSVSIYRTIGPLVLFPTCKNIKNVTYGHYFKISCYQKYTYIICLFQLV